MTSASRTIAVCGGGLAGAMTAASLVSAAGQAANVTWISDDDAAPEDLFYGSVTSPEAHNFLQSVGLNEATLFLESSTTFSYGTHFRRWPSGTQWLQCHHQPFQVLGGVPLHHHLTRSGISLEPLLISAQAALAGRFAHPPQDPGVPLSRAEYGYQFSAPEWVQLLTRDMKRHGVRMLSSSVASVEHEDQAIRQVRLKSGETVRADLFVDCTGSSRSLVNALGGQFQATGRVVASQRSAASQQLGPPCRVIEASDAGWSATSFLQGRLDGIAISHDEVAVSNLTAPVSVELGRLEQAWRGNCVAIGHAAATLEPLTPAPMKLLQRDIERLLELIPVSDDMTVERREFNRRFQEDVSHSRVFQDAIIQTDEAPSTPYWRGARERSETPEVQRKIAQFMNRGLLVKFDLEPFNDEDWLIMHAGMGRVPSQYDLQVEKTPRHESERLVADMQRAIGQLVPRLPPHQVYVANMKRYLEKQRHG